MKKTIFEMILVFMLGVLFILAMCWNANQYDNNHSNQNQQMQTK